ncbi:hypothetical protein [Brachybacterium alimentarium]|uniref:hypothetical protein n=1 Tax=Brachybacterium alimentarium TaxID=47845 RepID=UPI003FD00F22
MKKGMTPEVVEKMGQQIAESGERAQQIYTQVQGRVSEFDWTGEDRDRFVSEFDGELGQLVQQIVQQASQFTERASQNAAAQREASA